jgi:hypothetical protein
LSRIEVGEDGRALTVEVGKMEWREEHVGSADFKARRGRRISSTAAMWRRRMGVGLRAWETSIA